MAKYGMVIDVSKCTGCYGCFIACKDEHCGNDFPPYALSQPNMGHFWMRIIEKERGKYPKVKADYIPVPCMHCDKAPCVEAADNNAVYRRPDGIVIIDPEKSKNKKDIVKSCPYRVIYWNEEKGIPQKCTFCAHLLDQGWKEPRCVEVCPTGALTFGNLDDPNSEVAKLLSSAATETLHPEYGIKEKVAYIALPKKFVAGTVIFGDTDECGRNAVVTLTSNGKKWSAKADIFGDFEFDGLEEHKKFSVKIEHPGYKPRRFNVETKNDVYLGEIVLKAQ